MKEKEKIIEKVSETDFDISSISSLTVGLKGVGVFIFVAIVAFFIVKFRHHLKDSVLLTVLFLIWVIIETIKLFT